MVAFIILSNTLYALLLPFLTNPVDIKGNMNAKTWIMNSTVIVSFLVPQRLGCSHYIYIGRGFLMKNSILKLYYCLPKEKEQRPLWPGGRWRVDHARRLSVPQKVSVCTPMLDSMFLDHLPILSIRLVTKYKMLIVLRNQVHPSLCLLKTKTNSYMHTVHFKLNKLP